MPGMKGDGESTAVSGLGYPCLYFAGSVRITSSSAGNGYEGRVAADPAETTEPGECGPWASSSGRSWRLGDCRITGGYCADGTGSQADPVVGGRLVVVSVEMVERPTSSSGIESFPVVSLRLVDTGGAEVIRATAAVVAAAQPWPGSPEGDPTFAGDGGTGGTTVESELTDVQWPEPTTSVLVRQLRAASGIGRLWVRVSLDRFERELDPVSSTSARIVGSLRPRPQGASGPSGPVETFLTGSEVPPNWLPTGWDRLTPAELRVAALAATGLTSRQIGEALYVSRRTVESHLDHVYRKLGHSSRIHLAAEVVRRIGIQYP